MSIVRKIVAVTVAAGALGLGLAQAAQAAPLAKSGTVVTTMGGGQGNWPLAK